MNEASPYNELATIGDYEVLFRRVEASNLSIKDKRLVTALIKDSSPYMYIHLSEGFNEIQDIEMNDLDFEIDPNDLIF